MTITLRCLSCGKFSEVYEEWNNCPYCGNKYVEQNIDIPQLMKRKEEWKEYSTNAFNVSFIATALVAIGLYATLVFSHILSTDWLGYGAWITIIGFFVLDSLIIIPFVRNRFVNPKFPELYRFDRQTNRVYHL